MRKGKLNKLLEFSCYKNNIVCVLLCNEGNIRTQRRDDTPTRVSYTGLFSSSFLPIHTMPCSYTADDIGMSHGN